MSATAAGISGREISQMTAADTVDRFADQEAECLRLIDQAWDVSSYAVASSRVYQLPLSMPEDRHSAVLDRLEAKRQEISRKIRSAG